MSIVVRRRERRGRRPRAVVAALVLACAPALAAEGCRSALYAWDADDLRARIARKVRDLPADAVVVPFEVDAASVGIARRAVMQYASREDQARALVEIISSGAGYGVTYQAGVTSTAREAMARHRGNCLALASVFVGLARALGLEAYYADASARVHETSERAPGVVVDAGHVTAYIDLGPRRYYLDFDYTLGPGLSPRVISDLEATAHFYNNRGYERLDFARADGQPPDWAAAAQDFILATRIVPGFALAWNNLGVAWARLGEAVEAETAYRAAIDADPTSAAPYTNLGSLYLQAGRAAEALEVILEAVALAPGDPQARFNLGRALLATGDLEGARAALRTASELRDRDASRMLNKLQVLDAGHADRNAN